MDFDEPSDQLRIAVTEAMRAGEGDTGDVRQHCQPGRVGDLDQKIMQTHDDERRRYEVRQAFQRAAGVIALNNDRLRSTPNRR